MRLLVIIRAKYLQLLNELAEFDLVNVKMGARRFAYPRQRGERDPMSAIMRFVNDSSGASAIEYGLLAAGISIAIIATVTALGTTLNTTFNSVNTQLR
jgi:pilus assembly protein Flp/PilA